MTTKSALLTRQQSLREELEKLTAAINSMPDDKPVHVGRWKPEATGRFWYIYSSGVIGEGHYDGSLCLERRFAMGNVYRTKEEAERAADRRLVHVELQDLADAAWAESGEVLDWGNDDQAKYEADYNLEVGEILFTDLYRQVSPNTVYFPTEASYRAAIEKIGAERFEKYCKGV